MSRQGQFLKSGVIEESHSAFYRANYLLLHMNGTEKKKKRRRPVIEREHNNAMQTSTGSCVK